MSTVWIASSKDDLPEPLGPTIATLPLIGISTAPSTYQLTSTIRLSCFMRASPQSRGLACQADRRPRHHRAPADHECQCRTGLPAGRCSLPPPPDEWSG